MNKERLMVLANWLLAGAPHKHVKFNMSRVLVPVFKDGSVNDPDESNENIVSVSACIAGCTNIFFETRKLHWLNYCTTKRAAELLDLDEEQSFQLFYASSSSKWDWGNSDPDLHEITPEFAGTVIKNFVKTGVINWRLRKFMGRASR